MPFSSAINWRISITQNWWLVSLYLCSSDVGEAEQRTGSRNKKTRKLVGASADSKRKKKDTQLEQDAEQGQLQEDLSPIPESEIVSHPTGTYIENRGVSTLKDILPTLLKTLRESALSVVGVLV
jgi:hypothetical protein